MTSDYSYVKMSHMITAKIIKDSISEAGKRITTFELEYPRFIHSEFMTHRVFSRNAASSRAIPLKVMLSNIWKNPAMPISWGKNQSGMTAKEELNGLSLSFAQFLWIFTGQVVCILAWLMGKSGIHKQIVNRMVEPWSHIKVVVTSTEWDNFFSLRNHPDAQPEIHRLASNMWTLYRNKTPIPLKLEEWHLPYVHAEYIGDTGMVRPLDIDDAKKLSASLCAQVSYRKSDESLDKALRIFDRLITSKPPHASPFEHQSTPLVEPTESSGNFKGWHQYRQDIPDNVCNIYNSNI